MVVPFSPGGTSDTLARILGQKITEAWSQQVVDSRPGASGIIGTEIAMRAPAGGYTLMHGNMSQFRINPGLYHPRRRDESAPYDDDPTTLAQTAYPAKPIRLVVPFSPGGASDTLARILGRKITEAWGQQVVVDSRPGASGRPRAVSRVPACGM